MSNQNNNDLQLPNLSPKCLAARFMASVTLAFKAFEMAVPNCLSIESPAPQSSLKAPERLCVSLTNAV